VSRNSGSVQYCGSAPSLPECRSHKEVAYSSYQKYNGDDKILMK
jgi:hypothetical protein